jgi:hypothetical protein
MDAMLMFYAYILYVWIWKFAMLSATNECNGSKNSLAREGTLTFVSNCVQESLFLILVVVLTVFFLT